jgi:hypothetical protein
LPLPQTDPPVTGLLLLLGLSFVFGFAFEEFYRKSGQQRPGGVHTFPLLATAGGMLLLLDPARLLPFSVGLLVLGTWLFAFYRSRLGERDPPGESNVGLMVPVCNVHAYLLGAVALALPHWVAVTVTVAPILLLIARERLHGLADRVEVREIATAGQFLIPTGIVLPLLPSKPVTVLTAVTPRQAWLALLAVCTVSYAGYLLQRFVAPKEGDLWMAASSNNLLKAIYSGIFAGWRASLPAIAALALLAALGVAAALIAGGL